METTNKVDANAEYRGTRLLIFTGIFIPIQVFCVALRYLARYLVKAAWGLDDIVVLASLVIQMCFAGLAISSVIYAGVGYHTEYLQVTSPEKLSLWAKYIVTSSILYWACANVPKLAILLLYRRLFPNQSNRVVIQILMGILVAQSIATTVAALFGWFPFDANAPPKVRHGVDNKNLSIYGSLPNIITDVAMLILPMRIVWYLHLTMRLKVGLTITFLVGSLGLITSIIRFITFFQNDAFEDSTWSSVNLTIWTQVEIGMYLISACLMNYRPLLERFAYRRINTWQAARAPKLGNKDEWSGSKEHSADIMLKPKLAAATNEFQRLEDGGWNGSR